MVVKPNIICIAGKSNSGKTTLMEKLISELGNRGYKVGAVKHAHRGFDMDREGKDSWRHKRAGARASLVIAEERIALIKDDRTDYIQRMERYLSDMDIILAEGFKKQDFPKIEVFRKDVHKIPLCTDDPNLIASVTDSDFIPGALPVFGLEDIGDIASFIEDNYLRK